jgi:hypothetical protein
LHIGYFIGLSGALGKSIWTLLPFAPDWRWMLNRRVSYETKDT